MRKLLLLTASGLLYITTSFSQQFSYSDTYTSKGFEVIQSSAEKVKIAYSVGSWNLSDVSVNREIMKKIELPGHFLPNDEGMPDLPGSGHYLAIPQGASANLRIVKMQTETIANVNISHAPRIPKTTENGPLQYFKSDAVYSTNSFYPSEPVQIAQPTQIRGVDVVMLGITPFQYNPVTRELKVIRNIEIEVTFEGGNGQFGDNRLRSRWWEPLLADMLVNYEQLIAPTLTPSPNWGRAGEGAAGSRDGDGATEG